MSPPAREVIWDQEEPRNTGAWIYVASKLVALLQSGQILRYSGRPERASPAERPTAHTGRAGPHRGRGAGLAGELQQVTARDAIPQRGVEKTVSRWGVLAS